MTDEISTLIRFLILFIEGALVHAYEILPFHL
jgi:hypothetical protein